MLVFATVYRYLAGLEDLAGASFFAIADLGQPDGLLRGINLLPILMTAANFASATIYGDTRSKRLQAYGLAVLFLVLLYGSRSGLVLYWTSNNLFSLLRNWIEHRLVPRLPEAWTQRFAEIAAQE